MVTQPLEETSSGRHSKSGNLSQHLSDVVLSQLLHKAFLGGNKLIGKAKLLLLQRKNFFFYRIPCNKLIGEYLLLLADAVCAIHGLCFDCRVPPRVKNKHVVSFRQVETETSGLYGYQEHFQLRIFIETL